MRTNFLLIPVLVLALASCNSQVQTQEQQKPLADSKKTIDTLKENESKSLASTQQAVSTNSTCTAKTRGPKTPILGHSVLATQVFSFSSTKDTVLKGKKGTILKIGKNTFVDPLGNIVTGNVNIELKECLDPLDMVLGNLTTTTNGQYLQSGGMVYVNAVSGKTQLSIADNKSIKVTIPSDSTLAGMQVWEGEKNAKGINWVNPQPMMNRVMNQSMDKKVIINDKGVQEVVGKGVNMNPKSNVARIVWTNQPAPSQKAINEVSAKVWGFNSKKGIMITKDSNAIIDGTKCRLEKGDIIQFGGFECGKAVPGTNTFRENADAKYVFTMKKLGWANIDRLFSDPRNKQIDFVTAIDKHEDYKDICISLVLKNQNMYIPGYQKKDKTFSFTHGDYEKTSLPVGEDAIIITTAYKDDKVYYDIHPVTIAEKQSIHLTLKPTTKAGLKEALDKQL